MSKGRNNGICPLCGYVGKLTVHHSVWPRKAVPPKVRNQHTILICRECHDILHYFIEPRFCIRRYRSLILNREEQDDNSVA